MCPETDVAKNKLRSDPDATGCVVAITGIANAETVQQWSEPESPAASGWS